MGANAQTTVPTFTASQVLTADQQNQSARTGVPVFATTGTRDAGFGGTGEKTLAEGQLCYVEGTGLQTYNGTSWVTWGAAPSTGALTLIKTQTIGSAVSTITVTGAFSSTYDAYKITITGGTCSSDGTELSLSLGSTATGYYVGYFGTTYSSGAATTFANNNTTSWASVIRMRTNGINANIELMGPNLAKLTYMTGSNISATDSRAYAGFLNDTTQYTAFTLTAISGTATGGEIRVYGYQNS